MFAFSLVQQNPGSCSLENCLQKALHGSSVKLLNIGIRGGIFLKLFTVDVRGCPSALLGINGKILINFDDRGSNCRATNTVEKIF